MAKPATKKTALADQYRATLEAIAKKGGVQGAMAAEALKG